MVALALGDNPLNELLSVADNYDGPVRTPLLTARDQGPAKAIVGTVAVALLLAGTRWGSYIGIAPLFLTDILIGSAVVNAMLGLRVNGSQGRINGGRATIPLVFSVFFTYLIFRGILSFEYVFTLEWVRDLAPFLYAGLAFVSAWSLSRSHDASRAQTMRYIWGALIFHLAWTTTAAVGQFAENALPQLPISGVRIFSIRSDIDMAVLAVTAGLLLRRVLLGKNKFWAVAGLALTLFTAAMLHSRAGLISVAFALVASYALSLNVAPKGGVKRVALTLAVPLLLIGALAALGQTTPGERLIASIFNTRTGAANELNAQGTDRARELTWSGVFVWTVSDPSRTIIGSGFGNDFLSEAGVLTYLEGTTYDNVRSPHNWLIGVFARTGVVGIALAVLVLASLVRIIWRNRARMGEDELLTVSALIFLATIPVAMLGVVLEAPFGAVPFWWATGVLYTMGGDRFVIGPVKANSFLSSSHTRRPSLIGASRRP